MVGQVPPPFHGQAVMVEALLSGSFRHAALVHLPADYSTSLHQLGAVDVRKVAHMFGVVARALWARVRHRTTVLLYHPAGANRSAVVRDAFVLNVLRPAFGATVLHYHARGLPGAVDDLPDAVRWIARRALRGAEVAIAPSQALLDEALAFDPATAVVVPNGTPSGAHLPRPAPGPRPHVVFLNLLSEAKGTRWLLEALGELHRRGVPFDATFAGAFPDPATEAAFLQRRQQLGLDERVSLPGLVVGDDKWRLLRRADVFCVPTTYAQESFGLAMVEAASCGAAVVTTDTPGVREVFEPDVSAVLVDPDRPESLADALAELCRDPARRADLGRNAAALHAERYTLEHFWQGMDQAFTNLPSWSSSRSRERSSP